MLCTGLAFFLLVTDPCPSFNHQQKNQPSLSLHLFPEILKMFPLALKRDGERCGNEREKGEFINPTSHSTDVKCGHTDRTFYDQFSTKPPLWVWRKDHDRLRRCSQGLGTNKGRSQPEQGSLSRCPQGPWREGMAAWMGRSPLRRYQHQRHFPRSFLCSLLHQVNSPTVIIKEIQLLPARLLLDQICIHG